ncbi:transposase [Candidatus Parcubacteria bacterium]|nr:transposase [Candidatus Parcubacteria bacterium]
MPRLPRIDMGDYIYHVINRGTARVQIFYTEEDYDLFELVLEEAQAKFGMRILAYCVMPNHWHLVIYPKEDGEISKFMKWLTGTHTQRWHAVHGTAGSGHIYQGRYKSFVVEDDKYLLDLIRYVESNPLHANLVNRAEEWKWSSLNRRLEQCRYLSLLPTELPANYIESVNQGMSSNNMRKIQTSVVRSKPLGKDEWVQKMIERFKLQTSIRPRGRNKGT